MLQILGREIRRVQCRMTIEQKVSLHCRSLMVMTVLEFRTFC